MPDKVNRYFGSIGIRITTGTIVDPTIGPAPLSTRDVNKQRDPEKHQTKKGNRWCFGMKAQVGADSKAGIVHSAVIWREKKQS